MQVFAYFDSETKKIPSYDFFYIVITAISGKLNMLGTKKKIEKILRKFKNYNKSS